MTVFLKIVPKSLSIFFHHNFYIFALSLSENSKKENESIQQKYCRNHYNFQFFFLSLH